MYEINDIINKTSFEGLQVGKILDFNATEILQISLEATTIFPKHTSPTNATLLVLEGEISFFINNEKYILKKHQIFQFPKKEEHWVEAITDSKFLIFR
jgi:quercetin dioxygenase-like cupin family protein